MRPQLISAAMVLGIVLPATAAGPGDCKTVDDLWTKAFSNWMNISFEVENAAQQLATIRHVDISDSSAAEKIDVGPLATKAKDVFDSAVRRLPSAIDSIYRADLALKQACEAPSEILTKRRTEFIQHVEEWMLERMKAGSLKIAADEMSAVGTGEKKKAP